MRPTYQEIKNKIKPLDLILYKSDSIYDYVMSITETYAIGSGEFTQCGIVVTTDLMDIDNGKPDELYLWETTLSLLSEHPVKDIETGTLKYGGQIRNLDELMNLKYERIALCSLLDQTINSEIDYKNELNRLKRLFNGIRCDGSFMSIINVTLKWLYNIVSNTTSHMSFGMVPYIYQILGFLPRKIDPNDFAPVEFAGKTDKEFVSPFKEIIIFVPQSKHFLLNK